MMLNWFILIAAASTNSNFTEQFAIGQTVDLSQGFYVCGTSNSVETMQRIVSERDAQKRRALATSLHCPFEQREDRSNLREVVKIEAENCGPLQRLGDGQMCGDESHILKVKDAKGQVVTVIFMADDYIFD